jgi:hypothetical protein
MAVAYQKDFLAMAIKRRVTKTSESQRSRFIAAAREAGCSEDEAVFDENLKKIARHKPIADQQKKPKTVRKETD